MTNLTEITEPLREAWNGTDVELIDVMRHIAENVAQDGYTVLAKAARTKAISDFDAIEDYLSADLAQRGSTIVAAAFRQSADALEAQLLEDGTCPACGGELSSDGHDREASAWCSQCGKNWT